QLVGSAIRVEQGDRQREMVAGGGEIVQPKGQVRARRVCRGDLVAPVRHGESPAGGLEGGERARAVAGVSEAAGQRVVVVGLAVAITQPAEILGGAALMLDGL